MKTRSASIGLSAERDKEAGTATDLAPPIEHPDAFRLRANCAASHSSESHAFTQNFPISLRASLRGILLYTSDHITEHSWTASQ